MLTNTKKQYGIMTKLLHWVCALGFIVQFYLVYQRDFLTKQSSWNISLILLHKSIGMTLLFLGLLFVIWHACNTKPELPANTAKALRILAHSIQGLLLLFLIIMPLSGYIMSTAGGYPIKWFNLFNWPSLLEKNKNVSRQWHQIHVYGSYCVIGAFCIHTLAALKHQFINKDGILTRMLPGKLKNTPNS